MKIYCMSDIHGRKDLFDEMMEKIKFSRLDRLYILGDTIDRGGNLDLFNYVADQPNIIVLAGNHETVLRRYLDILPPDVTRKYSVPKFKDWAHSVHFKKHMDGLWKYYYMLESIKSLPDEKFFNGVRANLEYSTCSPTVSFTIDQINNMSKSELYKLKKRLQKLPTKIEFDLGDEHFILCHAGYDYDQRNNDRYLTGARKEFYQNPVNFGFGKTGTVIFGHTTTRDIKIHMDHIVEMPYTIWHGDNKIGIDCAASFPGGRLACLRLNDMAEFYVDNHQNYIVPVDYYNNKMAALADYERRVMDRYPDSYNSDIIQRILAADVDGTIFDHNAKGDEIYD